MKIIFNSYNTLAAGTSNVSRFILKALPGRAGHSRLWFFIPRLPVFQDIGSRPNVRLVRLPVLPGPLKWIFRAAYDLILFPVVTWLIRPDAVVVLANYAPLPVWGRKIVFLRHPHLVDPDAGRRQGAAGSTLEGFRKIIFILTLRTTDIIAVQSDYMKSRLFANYSADPAKVVVLPNPVSNFLDSAQKPSGASAGGTSKTVLYVSRFYPHKNHEFLMTLAERFQDRLRDQKVRFCITVSPHETCVDPRVAAAAERFISLIERKQLSDIIINLGEIAHERLAPYYRQAACFFFPSRTETFGNPLVEAMMHHLPLVVPELPYALAICGNAGLYYAPSDTDDAFEKIMAVVTDPVFRASCAESSGARAAAFPSADQWIENLFAMIDKPPGKQKFHAH